MRADEFNCLGPFSDARPHQCHADAVAPKHAERAPIELSDAAIADLVSSLGALSADPSPAPAAVSARGEPLVRRAPR